LLYGTASGGWCRPRKMSGIVKPLVSLMVTQPLAMSSFRQ
jgi:hypothetical protein